MRILTVIELGAAVFAVALVILISNHQIEPTVSIIVLVSISLLTSVAHLVLGRIDRRRELDEIVRRVREEDEGGEISP